MTLQQILAELKARKLQGPRPPGGDEAPVKIRTRLHVEKFDHSGETPTLVEHLVIEDGVGIVERNTFPASPTPRPNLVEVIGHDTIGPESQDSA
jgi:hypothetical protein